MFAEPFNSHCGYAIFEVDRSFDFGDAVGGGIFLELGGVVAGDDAVGIAAGELNHALLILDVGGVVGVGESGAGFVLGEVAVKIAIVGGQDEWRIAVDANILRGVGVVAACIGANAGENLDVVAVHEVQAAFRVDAHELFDIFGIYAAMIAAGLPGITCVVAKFFLLNPDICFRKKIDAAQMIPMGVADDDVRDFFGLESRELDGFVRASVFGGWKIFEESVAVIAAVEKNIVAAAADQPND